MPDAGVFGGKSSRGHGPEGVAEGVEECHPPDHQEHGLQAGYQHVDPPQDLCGLCHARGELIRSWSRCFGLEHLHAPHSQEREDGDREYDDTHASQPVGQASPEEQPVRHCLDVFQDSGSGRGEAGHGLKKCICEVGDGSGEDEGKAAEQREEDPSHGHDRKGFPSIDLLIEPRQFKEKQT